MKKILSALIIVLFMTGVCFAKHVELPPVDPKCKVDEYASCQKSCFSTLLNCNVTSSTFKIGKFVEELNDDWDCNTVTCSWSCVCVKKAD